MAAVTGEDFAGALKATWLTNGPININTNTGTAAFDVSGYTGKLMVCLSVGAGVSGTVIVPSIKAGADTNISNATNWVVNGTNFSTVAANQVINVDLRSSGFGSTSTIQNKYMYLTWLITGSATANSALDCVVIGQQKYSS